MFAASSELNRHCFAADDRHAQKPVIQKNAGEMKDKGKKLKDAAMGK